MAKCVHLHRAVVWCTSVHAERHTEIQATEPLNSQC